MGIVFNINITKVPAAKKNQKKRKGRKEERKNPQTKPKLFYTQI